MGYYTPLSAGDIIFLEGFKDGIEKCENFSPNLLFASVLKHEKYICKDKSSLNLPASTHSFATGHSAACFIKISSHKNFGLYDLSFQLAADNDFFEKIRLNSESSILYSQTTLGYFPPAGISRDDDLKSVVEIFRSRVKNKNSIILELALLAKRLYKFRKSIY